jgi:hypothetical protein
VTPSVGAVTVVLAGTAATISEVSSNGPASILWLAGLIGALAFLWRTLFRKGFRRSREFFRAWFGEPEAPGVDRRPGLPETVAQMAGQVHEIRARDDQVLAFMKEIAGQLTDNGRKTDALDLKVERVDTRVIGLDQRVTDHRRRNDETARLMREELLRRAAEVEEKLNVHNEAVDERLEHISEDLLRAETMRAALMELGLDVDPPRPQG